MPETYRESVYGVSVGDQQVEKKKFETAQVKDFSVSCTR